MSATQRTVSGSRASTTSSSGPSRRSTACAWGCRCSARRGSRRASAVCLGVEVGRRIADAGFTVITGSGPGLMQAANQGASEAGGRSIGLTIELPREEEPNPDVNIVLPFERFFVRKTVFVRYSCAFVPLPGGPTAGRPPSSGCATRSWRQARSRPVTSTSFR